MKFSISIPRPHLHSIIYRILSEAADVGGKDLVLHLQNPLNFNFKGDSVSEMITSEIGFLTHTHTRAHPLPYNYSTCLYLLITVDNERSL